MLSRTTVFYHSPYGSSSSEQPSFFNRTAVNQCTDLSAWDYQSLLKSLGQSQTGTFWSSRVESLKQLEVAIDEVNQRVDQFCIIELILQKDDCSKLLKVWGNKVMKMIYEDN